MGFQSVQIKCGNMRKPQDFTIYPYNKESKTIIVQSSKCIGSLNIETGEFRINMKGCYFPHLTFAQPVELDQATKEEIRRKYSGANNGDGGMIRII